MSRSATADRAAQAGPVSERVVSTVAELIGSEPLALEPLYETVDPDALNTLFEPGPDHSDRASRRVEFSYHGCTVVVSADGAVQVTDSEEGIGSH